MGITERKVILFIATSLDGYIAREDEALDWLFEVEGEGDNGYSAFYDTIDTLLMGRTTYDWILRYEKGEVPYQNKQCYVFTRKELANTPQVKFVRGEMASFISDLKSKEGQHIWLVGGGKLIEAFLRENLVDEMIVTVAPTLIGRGIPLFREGDYEAKLTLLGTKTYNQFVELHYKVNKTAST